MYHFISTIPWHIYIYSIETKVFWFKHCQIGIFKMLRVFSSKASNTKRTWHRKGMRCRWQTKTWDRWVANDRLRTMNASCFEGCGIWTETLALVRSKFKQYLSKKSTPSQNKPSASCVDLINSMYPGSLVITSHHMSWSLNKTYPKSLLFSRQSRGVNSHLPSTNSSSGPAGKKHIHRAGIHLRFLGGNCVVYGWT